MVGCLDVQQLEAEVQKDGALQQLHQLVDLHDKSHREDRVVDAVVVGVVAVQLGEPSHKRVGNVVGLGQQTERKCGDRVVVPAVKERREDRVIL